MRQSDLPPGFHEKLPYDDLVNADIYLLDYSLKEQPLLDLIAKGNKITIIDHHQKPVEAIAHVPIHQLVYDENESGDSLSWGHFFPELEMPRMVSFTRDDDLWRFELPETKGFISWLEQYPLYIHDFSQKLMMSEGDYQLAFQIGQPLYRYKMNLVADIIEHARPCVIKGKKGWVVNGPYPLASVVGDEISKAKGAYALIWSEQADSSIKMSFRSTERTLPQQLAIALGGNGHERAAGCTLTLQAFHKLMASSERALESPGLDT